MVRINTIGTPVIYQTDNSYNQPGVTGATQWNGTTRRLEVSDGSRWIPIDNNVNIATASDLENVILWAKSKINEERELEVLARTSPAVADLVSTIKDAQDKIKMIKLLLSNDDGTIEQKIV